MKISTPGLPDIQPIQLADGYTMTRPGRNIFHDSLDPDNPSPYVTFVPAGLREGTLAYLFANQDEAQDCLDRHALPLLFTFTHELRHTWTMVYVVAGDVTLKLDPDTRTRWIVEIPCREVTL